jgi:perosamine synthetase
LLELIGCRYPYAVVKGIPVFRPGFGAEELEALADVFKSGWIGPGPRAARFEERFAEFVGARYAVSVTSCTAALHLTLLSLGLGPGDEVLVPSLTFASTAHAAVYCGCDVTFVDVDLQTRGMDPADLAAKISSRSRAVIPVHYGGHPCRMDEIWEIASRHGLLVVEDAAHACGARYRGQRIGGLEPTVATCFSFNALKNLSTGDGGMITTNSDELAETARRLRWMGINKNTFERTTTPELDGAPDSAEENPVPKYEWYYEINELGFKYIMNDVSAALGLVQLDKLPQAAKVRRKMADRYSSRLASLDWLELPVEREEVRSAWHLYAIRTESQEPLRKYLQSAGIATSVHYFPLHLQPFYRQRKRVSLPVTERLARELVTLPFHPNLRMDEIDQTIAKIHDFRQSQPKAAGWQ